MLCKPALLRPSPAMVSRRLRTRGRLRVPRPWRASRPRGSPLAPRAWQPAAEKPRRASPTRPARGPLPHAASGAARPSRPPRERRWLLRFVAASAGAGTAVFGHNRPRAVTTEPHPATRSGPSSLERRPRAKIPRNRRRSHGRRSDPRNSDWGFQSPRARENEPGIPGKFS